MYEKFVNEAVALQMVYARMLETAGSNIWLYCPEGGQVDVFVCAGSEDPRWNEGVTALYLGRASGPNEQDSAWWLEGVCHQSDDGLYYRETGDLVGDLRDALKVALDEGDYPDYIKEELDRIEDAVADARGDES